MNKMLDRLTEISGMPKDVTQGAPILTMTGRTELLVENYRGILEYADALIRLRTGAGVLRVEGSRLRVEYYTAVEMKITGRIRSVQYEP